MRILLVQISFVILYCKPPAHGSDFTPAKNVQCMTWALKRIIGSDDSSLEPPENETMQETTPSSPIVDNIQGPRGRPRQGKRGAPGPPGPAGPAGPQGVCNCVPDEVVQLQKEYAVLTENLQRVRMASPETFCLLGMKDGTIPDSAITTSSNSGQRIYARLDYESHAWYPSTNNPGSEWIMVDLGKVILVTGVVTQGSYGSSYRTKAFQVEHSVDGRNFTDVTKTSGSEMVFSGNFDSNTKVVNRFPEQVQTRYVRIYPMSYNNGMYIRFDIIDC